MLDVLKRVERRGHYETALRLRAFAGRVFRYGFATLRTERNPADILRAALTVPKVKHHAAIIEPTKVGELLRAIDDYKRRPETLHALRIAPHVFLRPGELRQAKWSEIDFAEKVWRVPAERMKMKQPHAVPLSQQVLYMLQDLRSLARASDYLFPALHTTKRPLSDNTLNVALRRLGFDHDQMTSHGFRAMASTLLNESGSGTLTRSSAPLPMARRTGSGPPITAGRIGRRGCGWRNGGRTISIRSASVER